MERKPPVPEELQDPDQEPFRPRPRPLVTLLALLVLLSLAVGPVLGVLGVLDP